MELVNSLADDPWRRSNGGKLNKLLVVAAIIGGGVQDAHGFVYFTLSIHVMAGWNISVWPEPETTRRLDRGVEMSVCMGSWVCMCVAWHFSFHG
jgi:hypothetical protein